jgi:hypothetical protein
MPRTYHPQWLLVGLFILLAAYDARAARIEAVKGKEYHLSKQNGPWMIMVASFRPQSPDGVVREGKTPEQLAHDLVFELRSVEIPAYVYRLESPDELVTTQDRLGREETRKLLTSMDEVCVIAGNYPSLDDPVAQQTLKWIKKFRPQSLQSDGVSWLATKRRKGPLGGAFLTVNPLLSPEEIAAQQFDPFLLKINSGGRYSLLENPGKYSLVVATFSGKAMTHLGNSHSQEAIAAFQSGDDFSKEQFGDDLNEASNSAWELAVALRELDRKIDAYVWHDRYQSVVAVGSFDSPTDPRIRRYLQVFAPQPGLSNEQVFGAMQGLLGPSSRYFGISAGGTGVKFLTINSAGKNENEHRMWMFDPQPQLMRVPNRR